MNPDSVLRASQTRAWLRRAFAHLALILCLLGTLRTQTVHAEESPPLPPRVLPMPLGTLCVGILPSCARSGDTGLHLRIGMLAGLREDRSVGWVQGNAGFLISVMRWAELGVYLPVTWFDSIRPSLQPLRFGGKAAFLSPNRWQRLWGSVFTEVRIARGPFSGEGSPLGSQPTAVDIGIAMETRVWMLHAQGVVWLTALQSALELHAGIEAALRTDSIRPFVQARIDSRPGCPPSENPLCGVGGALVAGLRGSFDVLSAAPFAGVGGSSGHASVLVGVHTGLSFDVDFVARHGDGSAQAQAFWEHRAAGLRAWWAEQFAEREYAALTKQIERQHQALRRHLDEPLSTYLDALPEPLDALRQFRDALAEEELFQKELLVAPIRAATLPELRQQMAERRSRLRSQLHISRQNQRTLSRDAEGYPVLVRRDSGIEWERLIAKQRAVFEELEQERREQEEARRVPYRPFVYPPMEKVALNAALLAPFELLAAFYMGSPEGVAQMDVIRRDLRWLPYTEEERELGEAMEAAYQTMFAAGASLSGGMSRVPRLAAMRRTLRALDAEVSATALRTAEPVASTTPERLLGRLTSRLNPFNYAFDGLGSNFGNVRFRAPRGVSLAMSKTAEGGEVAATHLPEAVAERSLSTERRQLFMTRATQPGPGGVTPAGRALQKHAARPGSAFTGASGNAQANTTAATEYLSEILESTEGTVATSTHKTLGEVVKIRLPNGQGAWFKPDGEFIGFLEPYTPKQRP